MNRTTMPLALGLTAMVVLAACGSSSKAGNVTPGAPPSAATTSAPPATPTTAAGTVVKGATSGTLGAILVDAQGMTLYTLTSGGKAVACTGQCATFWPPLTLPAGTVTAMGAAGVTGLGTTTVSGAMQVTENGLPLYRFSHDKAPGDTNGEGLASFGGTWHVAKVGAVSSGAPLPPATTAPVTSPPATNPPTTIRPTTIPPATIPPATGGGY